jgi:hypothetical protein
MAGADGGDGLASEEAGAGAPGCAGGVVTRAQFDLPVTSSLIVAAGSTTSHHHHDGGMSTAAGRVRGRVRWHRRSEIVHQTDRDLLMRLSCGNEVRSEVKPTAGALVIPAQNAAGATVGTTSLTPAAQAGRTG